MNKDLLIKESLIKVVEVERPILDIGRIDLKNLEEELIEVTFRLNNILSEPIKIDKIKSSCTCTVSSYPKSTIEPNKWFEISATYDNISAGYFEQNLVVHFEDSKALPVLLVFRGKLL